MMAPYRLWSRDPEHPAVWTLEAHGVTIERCELFASLLNPAREWVILSDK